MENHKLVLPEHLNQFGFLFGGYLLAWVDEIAWIAATLEFPDCHFVTVGMDRVEFKKGVNKGAILTFSTALQRRGNTSVTYLVEVKNGGDTIFSNHVTLVRIDENGKKVSLPD